MSKFKDIFIEFLKLKYKEIEHGLISAFKSLGVILVLFGCGAGLFVVLACLGYVTGLLWSDLGISIKQTSHTFSDYWGCLATLGLIDCMLLVIIYGIFYGIYKFCVWIISNWKQAKINGALRSNE